jgi:hypothetical protein
MTAMNARRGASNAVSAVHAALGARYRLSSKAAVGPSPGSVLLSRGSASGQHGEARLVIVCSSDEISPDDR